ncbi:sushi domain-containing protein 3 [Cololabis saira]|uniref:sushi domain-containing protein 3 n=1 Tax=Cololabis saira TaxID=129043 RepID=UPI002AD22550|nr:sushi domain-containing protein 3 [Cololabis saira]
MSAATASVDLPRKEDNLNPSNSVNLQAQCKPRPPPTLGTQRIVQGNGTNVGTVISLQCPAKHKLVGKEVTCVSDINSTHWVGDTYCKPLSPQEDYGFRVAVLASVISSVIILFMSMAFLTCCLVDCIKKDKKKRQEREAWSLEEQAQENSRSYYNHKGRNNNNNNNGQEKMLPLWDTSNPALSGNVQPCRCHTQYVYSTPACTYGPPPPLAALPAHGYEQPLLPRTVDSCPPQYPGPPVSELVWQYGEQHSDWSKANLPTTDGSGVRNMNSNRIVNAKELSIRIISV